MALEEHQIAVLLVRFAAEEVVEADLVQRCAGGVGGNVSTQGAVLFVGPYHHGHGVPAHQALDAAFQLAVAGVGRS
jgi:hypothetical protein